VKAGYDVTLLHFRYGCRAEAKEIEAIKNVAHYLGCSVKLIDMAGVFRNDIGNSRLTNTYDELMTDRQGEASAELAYEWVPARNLVFYSMALAYAEAHKMDVLALGNNLEESGAYPDNEMIFTLKFAEIVPYAINLGHRIRIEQPVGNLMKHEIVKKAIGLGTPLEMTWSCYENGDAHCGTCGPCYMRKKAFEMNGLTDPVFKREAA
jgi:7-cyano-7-deazaguanine synthase